MKPFLTVLAALFTISTALAEREEHLHNGCYAQWNEKEIIIGNVHVERKWSIRNGMLTATSLLDKVSNTEWLRQPGKQPAPHPGGTLVDEERKLAFTTTTRKKSSVEQDSLTLKLEATGAKETLEYQFQIFPNSTGVLVNFSGGAAPVTQSVDEKKSAKARWLGASQYGETRSKKAHPSARRSHACPTAFALHSGRAERSDRS